MANPVVQQLTRRYSALRIYLHWISALVILWAMLSGFGVIALPVSHPLRQWVENFNPQLTSLYIPLFAWRLWLYLRTSSDAKLNTRGLSKHIARVAHAMIYLCISGVLLTGVLMMRHPVLLLGVMPLPQLIHCMTALADLQLLHDLLCAVLAALVAFHLAAALWHEVRGHSVMCRML